MEPVVLYHGSKGVVEYPEIRALTTLQFLRWEAVHV